jgi:two-component system chemotaxis response regulator CheB
MKRDIIVVGASAGGVEPLRQLVKGVPTNLAASILVVVHIPPFQPSELPNVLNASGPLPAIHPQPGQPLQPGTIYMAPPDFHLIVDDGHVDLWRGPRENRHRPSVNTLFRAAAANFGKRVVGVVLSGSLDDGSTGLWWVKRYGGVAMVQDPQEAAFPDMPQSALQHVEVDFVLAAKEMGPLLGRLAAGADVDRLRSEWQPEAMR